MNKKLLLLLLLVLSFQFTKAQIINISLPQFANQEFSFVLNKGIKTDTLSKSQLNFMGVAKITLPKEDKSYTGLGYLLFKTGQKINLIINKENFTVQQVLGSDVLTFLGSKENEFLYKIMSGENVLPDPTLYASHFVDLIRYTGELNNVVYKGGSLEQKARVKVFATSKMNMEYLYTSGAWQIVIDGLMRLSSSQDSFSKEMIKLIDKTKSPVVLEHLVSNLITITTQFGWEESLVAIASHVKKSGRIAVPKGDIFDAFTALNAMKGKKAPAIKGLLPKAEYAYNKTVVIFYQPDCPICEGFLDDLIKQYATLKAKGIRIVSISSDDEKANFEIDKKRFPWQDKLCDFEGMLGDNFTNYGILGTPTLFSIDKNNIILKRAATMDDVLE